MKLSATVVEALQSERIRTLRLSEPVRVTPDTSLSDTLRAMKASGSGCTLVCEEGRVAGIFTERDVLNKIAGSEVDLTEAIRLHMIRDPSSLNPDDTLQQAIQLMVDKGYRHVPLADAQGREAGMVCAKDLVEYIAEHFPAEVVNLPPRLHQVMRKPEGG